MVILQDGTTTNFYFLTMSPLLTDISWDHYQPLNIYLLREDSQFVGIAQVRVVYEARVLSF